MSPAEGKKRKSVMLAGSIPDEAGHKTKKKKKEDGQDTTESEINNHEEEDIEGGATSSTENINHKHSAVEAAEWKKRKKLYQKKRMQQPKFFLLQSKSKSSTDGEPNLDQSSNETGMGTITKRRSPVSLNEVLYLLEYGLLGNLASFRPSWCKLLRVAKVEKVVLIVLNGVTSRVYRRKRHCFPNIASRTVSAKVTPAQSYFGMLRQILSHKKSSTRFDTDKRRLIQENKVQNAIKKRETDAVNGLVTTGEKTKEQKGVEATPPPSGKKNVVPPPSEKTPGTPSSKKAPGTPSSEKAPGTPSSEKAPGAPAPDRSRYIVGVDERESRRYPGPDEEGFTHTKHSDTILADSPLFGIDCEMVLTSAGSELTRVSLTDEAGKVMYDSLVKPENPIRDYLTKFSGMTKSLLDPVETRLADAQLAVIEALPLDAILVGQGLENDLRALKLFHPHCVDTSNMFTGSERRVKLKLLAKEYLNRDIQCGSSGHDSVEDATAAVDLFKVKLAQGDGLKNFYQDQDYKKGPVFEARESIFQVAQEVNKKTCVVDTRTTLKKFKKEPVSCVVCSNDAEICKKTCSVLSGSDFVCMQLHGYSNLLNGDTVNDEDIEATLSLMDERVGKVLAALPSNTLHVTLMPGSVRTRETADAERGDFKVRNGRCVVGLKVENVVFPGNDR